LKTATSACEAAVLWCGSGVSAQDARQGGFARSNNKWCGEQGKRQLLAGVGSEVHRVLGV